MALGRPARRVRPHLHHLRGLRLRPPPGGIVTSQLSAVPAEGATNGATPGSSADHGGPIGTGSRATRLLGLVTLACIALSAYLSLVSTPADVNMGDAVRIIYIHVPIVVVAYVGCLLTTLGS